MITISSFLSQHLEPLSVLKKAVKLVFSLFAAVVIFGLFLLITPEGSKIALNLISELTPYKLHFSSLDGALYTNLTMQNFELKGPDLTVKAKQLDIGWDITQLFKKDKTIHHLNVKHLSIWYDNKSVSLPTQYNNATLKQAQADLHKSLPFALMVENINIHEARIHWNNIEHTLSELHIKHASSNLAHIEEIHYQGAFGSLDAYLTGAIKVNWDLNLSKNPFLVELNASAISTKGHITLPSRQLDDPQNQIQISVQAKAFTQGKHHLEKVNIDVKGTLANHHISLVGSYNNAPVQSTLTGKLFDKHWQGKVSTFKVNHERWQKIGNSTANIMVNWHDNVIASSIELLVSEKYPITLESSVAKLKPYALTGKVKTHFNQLRSLSSLIPSLSNLRGQLEVDLALSGTLLQPQWLGNIQLNNAKLPATSLGKKAVLNDLRLSFLPDNKVNINGKGLWGSGEFTIAGNGKLFVLAPSLDIKLKGEKIAPERYARILYCC